VRVSTDLVALWRAGSRAIPEGQSGPWRIARSFITEEQAAENRRQAEAFGETRYTPAGFYTSLLCGDDVWMADTPDEMFDHVECYEQAERRGGRILVHGLGLGLITRALLSLPQVEHVDVVELNLHVAALVYPAFKTDMKAGRLTIWHDDCMTRVWPRGTRWSCVWHDIWQAMVEANLPEMVLLHRKFASRCEWQGSWGKEWILRDRARRRKEANLAGVTVPAEASYTS
jgi:hypothetical protein